MSVRYTEKLMKLGEERERLTKQLQKLIFDVTESIIFAVPEGTEIKVKDVVLSTVKFTTNIASDVFFQIERGKKRRQIAMAEPGSSYYKDGDLSCEIKVASRDDFLFIANNIFEIISAFEEAEAEIIRALRQGFENLKAAANMEGRSAVR